MWLHGSAKMADSVTGCVIQLIVMSCAVTVATSAPSEDPWARAVALVARMTQEEKLGLLQGAPHKEAGYIGVYVYVPCTSVSHHGAAALILWLCLQLRCRMQCTLRAMRTAAFTLQQNHLAFFRP